MPAATGSSRRGDVRGARVLVQLGDRDLAQRPRMPARGEPCARALRILDDEGIERADALEHRGGHHGVGRRVLGRATRAGGGGGPRSQGISTPSSRSISAKRDERQAHERRGIVAAQAREERDAQPFALGAARAIERRLAREVALDLGVASKRAERHVGRDDALLRRAPPARASTQRAVWKSTARPLSCAQLRARALSSGAGLADGRAVEVGDLVASL